MPIYDYKCENCGTTYDVFHKVREIKEDVVCPECSSTRHVRLISAASVSVKGGSKSESLPPCGDASCCGGVCGMN
jgi:putative FmdB family regulatory protein